MALDIHIGDVLHNTVNDEVYLVIHKAVSVDAWQCFTVDPRLSGGIRTFFIPNEELKHAENLIIEKIGYVVCKNPEIWSDIWKKGTSGLKTLKVITDYARERVYSNDGILDGTGHKPKRMLRGSLIFQEA